MDKTANASPGNQEARTAVRRISIQEGVSYSGRAMAITGRKGKTY